MAQILSYKLLQEDVLLMARPRGYNIYKAKDISYCTFCGEWKEKGLICTECGQIMRNSPHHGSKHREHVRY